MGSMRHLVLIAYDISDQKDRRRVAEYLEARMVRVQDSLFEGWMTPRTARALAEGAARLIDGADSLRLYVMPPSSAQAAMAWGFPPAPEPGGHLIL